MKKITVIVILFSLVVGVVFGTGSSSEEDEDCQGDFTAGFEEFNNAFLDAYNDEEFTSPAFVGYFSSSATFMFPGLSTLNTRSDILEFFKITLKQLAPQLDGISIVDAQQTSCDTAYAITTSLNGNRSVFTLKKNSEDKWEVTVEIVNSF